METKLVHAGERREPPIGQPVATPLYATATYTYDSMAQMDQVFSGEGGDYVYSRYGNPTVGALVSIKLKDDTKDAAWHFMDNLKLCVRATSLGDVYTLVSHSASSSHRELSPKRRADLGIADSLVRILVGIENVKDIIADIEQALEK